MNPIVTPEAWDALRTRGQTVLAWLGVLAVAVAAGRGAVRAEVERSEQKTNVRIAQLEQTTIINQAAIMAAYRRDSVFTVHLNATARVLVAPLGSKTEREARRDLERSLRLEFERP